MDLGQFEERKKDHIRLALNSSHQAEGLAGWESVQLVHEALPDLDFESVSLQTHCLGRLQSTPFYVSGMTAGHGDASWINERLAVVAQAQGWAMGVGSQRRELCSDSTQHLDRWKELRKKAPSLMLFANVGLAQVIRTPTRELSRLVESLEAQALAIHLNALQEVIQPEGTPSFKGGLQAIERVVRELSVPVIIKETGSGFSKSTLQKLWNTGVAAVDVSGLGGTHWGRIEGSRATSGSVQASAAQTFANWGVSTIQSVKSAASLGKGSGKKPEKEPEIWASGGVRSGLDAAKLLALGAHRVGFAQPALQAALESEAALVQWMQRIEFELKVALFCTGQGSIQSLRESSSVCLSSQS